uniref:tripartite tricarboxylate transporter substrate-binding protein n=1 Tax=Tabrizicola sp. TaxID=2005166 RepID=UPI0035B0FB73
TDDHLLLVLMQRATGTSFTHVVFQGDPQLLTAILGKQVDVLGLNLGPVSANPDKLRTVAMAGASRSPFRPEVPTLKELGIDVVMGSERGIVAPAATPPAVMAKLREAMADVAKDPEFIRVMRARFTEPDFEDGEAWFTRLRGLQEGYRTLWERTPWAQR